MRDSIKKAIGETLQDMVNSGVEISFTDNDLKILDVTIPEEVPGSHPIKKKGLKATPFPVAPDK